MTVYRFDYSVQAMVSAFVETDKGSKAGDIPEVTRTLLERIQKEIDARLQAGPLDASGCILSSPSIAYIENSMKPENPANKEPIMDSDLQIQPMELPFKDALSYVEANPEFKIVLDDKDIDAADFTKKYKVIKKEE